MQTKLLLLLPYLCFYVTNVIGQDEESDKDWRTLWSSVYSEEDTIPYVWEQSGRFQGDILIEREPEISGRNIAKKKLWPKGIVPFVIKESDYSTEEIHLILDTMELLTRMVRRFKEKNEPFQNFCQLKFVPKDNSHKNYVEIKKSGSECSSFVGMQKKPQLLILSDNCLKLIVIIHELFHTIGFEHQHTAHNRNRFVDIIKENIMQGHEIDFQKTNSMDYTSYGVSFDFDSIMNSSPFAFAKVNKKGEPVGPTIVSKVPGKKVKLNYGFSDGDIQKLKHMYCN